MKLPDKIISGDSYQDVRRKINAICDYLRSVRPVAGPGVRLRQYTSGVIFEADRRGGAAASGSGYDGWFKVEAKTENDTTTIRIYDGDDPENPIAGYAYVNGKTEEFPVAELSPAEGWLCLKTDGSEHGFEILESPPSLIDADESVSCHVLAKIENANDRWSVRQLVKYAVPQLWIAGECDEQ